MKPILILFHFSFYSVLFSACQGPDGQSKQENINQSRILIDGSSTVFPVSIAVSNEFKKSHPFVKITVALSGTGGGFKKFGIGETDINDASRPIKSDELKLCEAHKIKFAVVQIGYDGLSVVVNPRNTWVKDITVAELKKMWEPNAQGIIQKWNQIRPGWPNEEFHLYGADLESGTYDYFTEVIIGKSKQSRNDYTSSEDDNILVQGIFSDINSLGFLGFGYYEENQSKLKLVPVDDLIDTNGLGPVYPSIKTVTNKSYSPLSRPLFIYINKEAARRTEVKDFIDFYIENAGKYVLEKGYIPMNENEYNYEKSKFKEFEKGNY